MKILVVLTAAVVTIVLVLLYFPRGTQTDMGLPTTALPITHTDVTIDSPLPDKGSGVGGTITGTIKFSGEPPALKTIEMSADPICVQNNRNQPVKSETLVLGSGNTVTNVFVWIKSGLPAGETYPTPTLPVIIDQRGCRYIPHVVGAQVGQAVKFLNSDGTLHNVHGLPTANNEFNLPMPKFKKELEQKFDRQEVVFPVKCDIHPWMQAYVGVVAHPFFAVTREDGRFKIAGLPPGTYEIEAWHEKLGPKTATVTVAAGETNDAGFTFEKQ